MVSLPFRTLREVLFQWPPQCPTISVCPLISLALSPDRSIDPIGSTICSLSFSLSLALSDFSIDYSVRVFRSLFSTFLLALSLAQKLSMEQQEICVRHDRILKLSFVLFCFCAFGYSLSHGNRTQHNGRTIQPADFPAPLYAVRLLVVRRLSRFVSRASTPSTSFTCIRGASPTQICSFLV